MTETKASKAMTAIKAWVKYATENLNVQNSDIVTFTLYLHAETIEEALRRMDKVDELVKALQWISASGDHCHIKNAQRVADDALASFNKE